MNVKTILRWVLAAFLLFLSFGGGNAPAIILLIAAAVLVAPIQQLQEKLGPVGKKPLNIVVPVVLFLSCAVHFSEREARRRAGADRNACCYGSAYRDAGTHGRAYAGTDAGGHGRTRRGDGRREHEVRRKHDRTLYKARV